MGRRQRLQSVKKTEDKDVKQSKKAKEPGPQTRNTTSIQQKVKKQYRGSSVHSLTSCDVMLLSQSDGVGEVGWDNQTQTCVVQHDQTDIGDLVKRFTRETSNPSSDEPPGTPPLVSLWMDSPRADAVPSEKTNLNRTCRRKIRRPKKNPLLKKEILNSSDILNKLAEVLKSEKTGCVEEKCTDSEKNEAGSGPGRSAGIQSSTQHMGHSNVATPLQTANISPIQHVGKTTHVLNQTASPVEVGTPKNSEFCETPKGTLRRNYVNRTMGTPTSTVHNCSSDELWTDEELFENDSFLRATQTFLESNSSPSPRIGGKRKKLGTPVREKKRQTFQLQMSESSVTLQDTYNQTTCDKFKKPNALTGTSQKVNVTDIGKTTVSKDSLFKVPESIPTALGGNPCNTDKPVASGLKASNSGNQITRKSEEPCLKIKSIQPSSITSKKCNTDASSKQILENCTVKPDFYPKGQCSSVNFGKFNVRSDNRKTMNFCSAKDRSSSTVSSNPHKNSSVPPVTTASVLTSSNDTVAKSNQSRVAPSLVQSSNPPKTMETKRGSFKFINGTKTNGQKTPPKSTVNAPTVSDLDLSISEELLTMLAEPDNVLDSQVPLVSDSFSLDPLHQTLVDSHKGDSVEPVDSDIRGGKNSAGRLAEETCNTEMKSVNKGQATFICKNMENNVGKLHSSVSDSKNLSLSADSGKVKPRSTISGKFMSLAVDSVKTEPIPEKRGEVEPFPVKSGEIKPFPVDSVITHTDDAFVSSQEPLFNDSFLLDSLLEGSECCTADSEPRFFDARRIVSVSQPSAQKTTGSSISDLSINTKGAIASKAQANRKELITKDGRLNQNNSKTISTGSNIYNGAVNTYKPSCVVPFAVSSAPGVVTKSVISNSHSTMTAVTHAKGTIRSNHGSLTSKPITAVSGNQINPTWYPSNNKPVRNQVFKNIGEKTQTSVAFSVKSGEVKPFPVDSVITHTDDGFVSSQEPLFNDSFLLDSLLEGSECCTADSQDSEPRFFEGCANVSISKHCAQKTYSESKFEPKSSTMSSLCINTKGATANRVVAKSVISNSRPTATPVTHGKGAIRSKHGNWTSEPITGVIGNQINPTEYTSNNKAVGNSVFNDIDGKTRTFKSSTSKNSATVPEHSTPRSDKFKFTRRACSKPSDKLLDLQRSYSTSSTETMYSGSEDCSDYNSEFLVTGGHDSKAVIEDGQDSAGSKSCMASVRDTEAGSTDVWLGQEELLEIVEKAESGSCEVSPGTQTQKDQTSITPPPAVDIHRSNLQASKISASIKNPKTTNIHQKSVYLNSKNSLEKEKSTGIKLCGDVSKTTGVKPVVSEDKLSNKVNKSNSVEVLTPVAGNRHTSGKAARSLMKYPSFGSLNTHDSPKTPVLESLSSSQDSKVTPVKTCSPDEIERKRQDALKRRQNRLKLTKK